MIAVIWFTIAAILVSIYHGFGWVLAMLGAHLVMLGLQAWWRERQWRREWQGKTGGD